MPVYDSKCRHCGRLSQYISTVEERMWTAPCDWCKGPTDKIILTAPKGYVKGKFDAFRSPVDGSLISTARQLQEHNSRNNVVNINDGFDEAKVISGNFNQTKLEGPDKKDIARDLGEAIHMVNSGYKPTYYGEADE